MVLSLGVLRILLVLALQTLGQGPSRPVKQQQDLRNPHGPIDIPCENCHTSTSWKPIRAIPEFNHDKTRYPLRGMHEKVQCIQCHTKLVFSDVGSKCADCHADIHRRQFGANCEQCHTVNGWTVSTQAIQNHFNRFPLVGAHASLQCDDCHKQAAVGQFTGLSTACYSCHAKDFQSTATMGLSIPNHLTAGAQFAPQNCEKCHGMNTWLGATFDHASTGFPLQGLHAQAACTSCHINNNYNLAGIGLNDCGNSGCHLTTWQQTTNPAHASNPTFFPMSQCSTCHTVNGWTGAPFDHSVTGFPLTNGHASVACTSCHINNNYNLTTALNSCGNSGCHLTTWQQTNNPVHSTAGAQFAVGNCAVCHTTVSWNTATFDHSATGFALTGMHVSPSPTPCASCHVNNNYTLSSAACYGCHVAAWQSTATLGGSVPNHATAGFPQTCESCHTTSAWTGGVFNHASTGFALTGMHASPSPTPCVACHVNGNYTLSSTACYGCHVAAWQSTATLGGAVPNHVSGGFPQTCENCHTTSTWTGAVFDHATTGFVLTGMHISPSPTPCISCHVGNNYTLTAASTACYGCHVAAWQSTATLGGAVPNHATAGFPQTCESCHTTSTWTGGVFNHATTGFALTGAHVSPPAPCASCHVNGNYTLSSPACYGCHVVAWQSTATLGGSVPNHITAAFPQDCSLCHTTSVWTGGVFNHASTGFALTGMHISPSPTPCVSCHVGNNYTLTAASTACYGCHITAWQSTATLGGAVPNHVAASFPQDCSLCHTTSTWLGSVFNHNATIFPLTGFHATAAVTCAMCHVNNNYTTLPTDCYGCHAAAYNTTTNPAHAAAGFPTTCATCHTTAAWTGATFNHTYFPLNHGNANGVCATCHINPANYLVFQCTQCHGGGNAANFNHPNVGGYVYNSVNCYQCHTH